MRTTGIRGLLGQVYTVENGVLELDDSNAVIPLSGVTNGFYYVMASINYLTETATCELKIYKSKGKFQAKPSNPYQVIIFNVSNHYDPETGLSTFADFDTYFADTVTKVSGKNEQRSAVDMINTFTGSSDFEVRNGIMNTANYTSLTSTTT